MKKTLLTVSLLLSLTAVAENEPQAPQAQQPATSSATASAPQARDVIPCPLPGEPATNCPTPREPEVTEAGTGATAGGNVHNVLHLGLLLSSPKGNALHESNSQPIPSPLRPSPVKDEK